MNLYQQIIPDGLLKDSSLNLLDSLSIKIDQIRSKCASSEFSLITNLRDIDYTGNIIKTASNIQNFKNIVVLGTGGSSLTGQALIEIAQNSDTNISFIENIDPDSFDKIIGTSPPEDSAYIVISKSGETLETITQCLICISNFIKSASEKKISEHFYFISDPKGSTLRSLAEKYRCTIIDHEADIGGRYSIFTNVALLPAKLAGLDIKKIREGAIITLNNFLNNDSEPVIGALLNFLMLEKGINISVTMPYVDRLIPLTSWHRQIWAESLGKNGKGSIPVRAKGTVDQHSQLQLYLDGPKDKFFTLINLEETTSEYIIDNNLVKNTVVSYLAEKTMGEIIDAEYYATRDALVKKECPLREIIINEVSEESIGALAMHFILETILVASFLDINPFDQPAVEDVKSRAREILKGI
jgi:glucose-6-phosphate isomerase